MIISCPNCAKQYSVDDSKLTPNKKLRCTACKNIWVYQAEEQKEAVDDIDVFFNKEENHDEESELEKKEREKIIAKKKPVIQKKQKSIPIITTMLFVSAVSLFLCVFFKDYILKSAGGDYVKSAINFLYDWGEKMPLVENINYVFQSPDILEINGEVKNSLNEQTDCRFLTIKVTPDFGSFFKLLFTSPRKLMSFLDNVYVKLDKSVLNPNEKIDFVAKLKIDPVNYNLIKILPTNLK